MTQLGATQHNSTERQARGAVAPAMQPSAFTYNTLIRGLCRMAAAEDSAATGPERAAPAVQGPPPSAAASAAVAASAEEEEAEKEEDGRGQRVQEDLDMSIGVFADEDLLRPSGGEGAARDDPAPAIMMSKPGYFYEKGSPPAATAAASAPATATESDTGGRSGSAPGILPESAGGGVGESALPEGIQEALRVRTQQSVI